MPDLPSKFKPANTGARRHTPKPKVQRMRGRTLQRERKRLFDQFPLCVRCYDKGIVREATERDHIIPLSKGGTDDPSNVQGLCSDCHADKTREDMGHKPKRVIGPDGWPIE